MKKNLFILKQKFTLVLACIILTSAFSSAQWIEKTKALKWRSEVVGVVYDSKVYTFLGFGNSQLEPEPSSEVYDPATDTWTLLASIPDNAARTHQGVALIDNTVWHIGGRVGKNPGPLSSDIWIYNISTNSWYRGPQLEDPDTGKPLLWAAGGAVLLGRTLHIVGGFVSNACNNDQSTYHLTLNVDSWLSDPLKPAKWVNDLAPLPVKRNHFSTTTLGGKIYVLGGQFGHDCGGGQDKSYSHVYDPATDMWTQLPTLPADRSHTEGGVFTIDGKIYIVAGQGEGGKSTNMVTVFDPAGNGGAGSWKDESSLALPRGYEGVSAKVIGNTFIISHGGEGSSYNVRRFTYTRTIDRNPVYKLGFSSGCLNLSAVSGSSVTGKTLLFTIDGSKSYTTSTSADWLTVTKNAVGIAIPNAADIEVTANTEGLAPGNYNAIITAKGSGDGPGYTEAKYCVNLTVKSTGSFSKTLEAETAELAGVAVASDHPDFSGTGFADYIHPYDDYIEWSVNKPEAGSALLQFRYSNGKEPDRPLKLEVNGVAVNPNISFPATGSWKEWAVSKVTVNLNAGINTVRLTAIGSSGPNIDYLAISTDNTNQTAEKATSDKSVMLTTSDQLKAYVTPNPASGNAKLVLTSSSTLPVEMHLIDISGRTYRRMKFSNNGSNSFDFSVRDLPAGIYIIKIMQGKNLKSTRLIVENRGLH